MKNALKIGFRIAIDNWYSIVKTSTLFLLTCVLLTLVESFLIYELLTRIVLVEYGEITNILEMDFSRDFETYLHRLFQSVFYPLMTLNSFFIGVYLHQTGFPQIAKQKTTEMDHILDVPFVNDKKTISELFQYIKTADWRNYLMCLVFLILMEVVEYPLESQIYALGIFARYLFFWLLVRMPYILLFWMYYRWMDLSTRKDVLSKDRLFVFFLVLVIIPALEKYISLNIKEALIHAISFVGFSFYLIIDLFIVLITVLISLLWLPFISVFYTQTAIAIKNEKTT